MADFIDFEKRCIDPIAKQMILASLDYALSTHRAVAVAAGLINPTPETAKQLRESIFKTPNCGGIGPGPATAPQGPQKYSTPVKIVRSGQPVVSPGAAAEVKRSPVIMPTRTLPPLLGKARWDGPDIGQIKHGQVFDNPTAMGRALGFTTKEAATTVVAYKRAGFNLVKDSAGVWGAVRIPGTEIPSKWRIEQPEVRTSPPKSGKEPEMPKKIGPPRVSVKDSSGKIIKWQDEFGRDVPPENWPKEKSTVDALIDQIPSAGRDVIRKAVAALPVDQQIAFLNDILSKVKK